MIRSIPALAALSLLALLPAPSARAADAPAPSASSTPAAAAPVKPQAAELARLMVTKDEWSSGMDQLAKGAQGQMQSHPGSKLTFPADFGAKVRAEVDKVLPYEELIGMHARELSAGYSEKELTDLVAFFKSPLGQKYMKVAPRAGENVAQQTQQRFAQKMPEVMQKLTAGLQHPDPKKAGMEHPAPKASK
jgi:hypothetical protein